MLTELTSKQCDAFVQEHDVEVRRTRYGIRDTHPWYCGDSTKKCPNYVGKTREAVITKYWLEYHPNWTPPVIHDEAWALRIMAENELSWGTCSELDYTQIWTPDQRRITTTLKHVKTVDDIIEVVRQWAKEYDPDKPKPTREQTAVELLGEVHTLDYIKQSDKIADLSVRIEDFLLKEADHVD